MSISLLEKFLKVVLPFFKDISTIFLQFSNQNSGKNFNNKILCKVRCYFKRQNSQAFGIADSNYSLKRCKKKLWQKGACKAHI